MRIEKLRTRGEVSLRDRVLDAGVKLFAAQGYEAVSMRAICETAGVSKGAVYHHFASKQELLSAIVVAELEALLAHIGVSTGGDCGAHERLQRFIVSQAEYFDAHAPQFRVAMARFTFVADEAGHRQIEGLRRRYVRVIRGIIAYGIDAGEFRAIDARAGTRMVLAILYWLARWHRPSGKLRAADIALAHADIMLRGVLTAESKEALLFFKKSAVCAPSQEELNAYIEKRAPRW